MSTQFSFVDNFAVKDSRAWGQSDFDKGQIYTKTEVVDFMISTIGLNTANDFENVRILEPSCGEGKFVIAIVQRLININKKKPTVKSLLNKILAIDLVSNSIDITKSKVESLLVGRGYSQNEISILLENWFLHCDFLLANFSDKFTHVIGNPPYVRVENIPKHILFEYRKKFSTMTDRADLYISFFEKSLSLLQAGGRLSFICTDRWTKNIYGKSLRKFIGDNYGLELFIDLYGIDAFEKDVMTYPAITQIVKDKCEETILKHETLFSDKEAIEIRSSISGKSTVLQKRKGIVNGEKPWLFGSSEEIALIHKIEKKYSPIEEAGCRVCIGTATGSNKVYIVNENQKKKIEPCRLLPVITAYDLKSGKIKWRGRHIINTYDKEGVIQLNNYPKLKSYLFKHKTELENRYVAKQNTSKWFKTIDRVYEERRRMEKLLIPDISNDPIVIYDSGEFHPNNSIYYILSNNWNLHALRVILLSNICKLFISTYSTKMAKGYLRFQAQHLRKVCIPEWQGLSKELQVKLIEAGKTNHPECFTGLAAEAYKLTEKDISVLGI